MTRHEFLMASAAGLALPRFAFGSPAKDLAVPRLDHASVKPRNRRPYAGVDWTKCLQINTTSHGHCTSAPQLKKFIQRGFGLMTMSNYYPSVPYVPAREMTVGHWRVHHDHPVVVNGVRTDGPFDWNAVLAPWVSELPEEQRRQYPFKPGVCMFPNWPADMLEAPNAEHHMFKMDDGKWASRLHLCAPGSAYCSGTFDARDKFKTWSHGYAFGCGESLWTSIDRMIDALICPDGGGVTVNHPTWTRLDRRLLLKLLDYDPRVLGLEVIEGGELHSEHYWDWVLSTGRQCFGFFVPDHNLDGPIFGVNVLVVPERTVPACLKAYREGNFYGAARGLGELKFTSLGLEKGVVTARTDKPARFEVITARGVVQRTEGTSVSWKVPDQTAPLNAAIEVFARIKATAADGCGEILFSQPFMLVP